MRSRYWPAVAATLLIIAATSVAWIRYDLEWTSWLFAVLGAGATAIAALIRWARLDRPADGQISVGQRAKLINLVRLRWIGYRDEHGHLRGDGQLAQDLVLPREYPILLDRGVVDREGVPYSITGAWDRSGGRLALTGAPGSGKSVQLRLLAESLLNDAERDPSKPIPIIVGLASWRPSRQRSWSRRNAGSPRFLAWLNTTMRETYHLTNTTVDLRRWLSSGLIVPILDGLDEVPLRHQENLFRELREWISDSDQPPQSWAIACRTREYSRLESVGSLTPGVTSSRWYVRPLDDEQRLGFLEQVQEQSDSDWRPVIDAIRQKRAASLTSVAEDGILATPLGLSIAARAYSHAPLEGGPRPAELLDRSKGWDQLWSSYVQERFESAHADPDRYQTGGKPDLATVTRWLGTVASGCMGYGRVIDPSSMKPPKQPKSAASLLLLHLTAAGLGAQLVDGLIEAVRAPLYHLANFQYVRGVLAAGIIGVVASTVDQLQGPVLLASIVLAGIYGGWLFIPVYVFVALQARTYGPPVLAYMERSFDLLQPTSVEELTSRPVTLIAAVLLVLMMIRLAYSDDSDWRRSVLVFLTSAVAVVFGAPVALLLAVPAATFVEYVKLRRTWTSGSDLGYHHNLAEIGVLAGVCTLITAVTPLVASAADERVDVDRLLTALDGVDGRLLTTAIGVFAIAVVLGALRGPSVAASIVILSCIATLSAMLTWSATAVFVVGVMAIVTRSTMWALLDVKLARGLFLAGLAAAIGWFAVDASAVGLTAVDVYPPIADWRVSADAFDVRWIAGLALGVTISTGWVLAVTAVGILLILLRPITRRYDEIALFRDRLVYVYTPRVVLRWWYRGVPFGKGGTTDLIPPPDAWNEFLEWSAYRGYLRRVGGEYYWMHDKLRAWFAEHADHATIKSLTARVPSETMLMARGVLSEMAARMGLAERSFSREVVPGRDRLFRGRTDVILALAQGRPNAWFDLFWHPRAAPPTLQAVVGPSGVGKSATVAEYMHRYTRSFDKVGWFVGADTSVLEAALTTWAREELFVPTDGLPMIEQISLIHHRLRQTRESFLLVLDGLAEGPDITRILPQQMLGQIIIVTQSASMIPKTADVIEIGRLSDDEAMRLLEASAGQLKDSAAASRVVQLLDGSAPGLRQAAAVVREGRRSLADLVEELSTRQTVGRGQHSDSRSETLATVPVVMECLSEEGLEWTVPILERASVLAAEWITLDVFEDEPAVSEAVIALGRYGLITVHHEIRGLPVGLSVDGATRDTVLRLMKDDARVTRVNEVAAQLRVILSRRPRRSRLGADFLWPHVRAASSTSLGYKSGHGDAGLLITLGEDDYAEGRLELALRDFIEAEELARRVVGETDPVALYARACVGAAYGALGDHAIGLEILSGVVEAQKRLSSKATREILRGRYYLALAQLGANDVQAAQGTLEDVLSGQRMVLSQGDYDMLETKCHLARVHGLTGDFGSAIELLEDILDAEDDVLSAEDYLRRQAEAGIAESYQQLGDYEGARSMCQTSLARWWEATGSFRDGPISFDRYRNVSVEEIAEDVAFNVWSSRYGDQLSLVDYRCDVIDLKLRMASILNHLGDYEEALMWQTEAFIAQRFVHGEDHTDVHVAQTELAALRSHVDVVEQRSTRTSRWLWH